ncbi:MAG: hypothetical protein MJA83_02265, partial [Gammaproteobacteria bacterium]|nr:hypothetical protein [Gammaproteobacteria bacterium]
VDGGVIASLGTGHLPTVSQTLSENRRFYYPPDISLADDETGKYLLVAIGSGYRAHPKNTDTVERFYAVKDPYIYSQVETGDYTSLYGSYGIDHADTVTNAQNETVPALLDLTTRIVDRSNFNEVIEVKDAKGWYISFTKQDGTPSGEKVLAEATTIGGKIIFTTFTPVTNTNADECHTSGMGRYYAVSAAFAAPTDDLYSPKPGEDLTLEDRSKVLGSNGIPPELIILFPEAMDGESVNIVGTEKVDIDTSIPPVRTFWYQESDLE